MGIVKRIYIIISLLGIMSTVCIVVLTVSTKSSLKIPAAVGDGQAKWHQQRKPDTQMQKNHRNVEGGNLEPNQYTGKNDALDDAIFSVRLLPDSDHRTNRNTASVKDEKVPTQSDTFSIFEDGHSKLYPQAGNSNSKEAGLEGVAATLLMNIQKEYNYDQTYQRQDKLTSLQKVSSGGTVTATKKLGGREDSDRSARKDQQIVHVETEKLTLSDKLASSKEAGISDIHKNRMGHFLQTKGGSKAFSKVDRRPMLVKTQTKNLSQNDAKNLLNNQSEPSVVKNQSNFPRRTVKKSPSEVAMEVASKISPQVQLKPVVISESILEQANGSYPTYPEANATLTRVLTIGSFKPGRCKPQNNLAMIKTHKCSSSTLQNILYRWGDDRNLTFVLPRDGPYIGHPQPFDISHAQRVIGDKYNILANHARYNKEGLKRVMPSDTVYFTVLRDPVKQFESAFTYYKFDERYGVAGLRSFLKQPEIYFQREPVFPRQAGRNQMLYDLGLDARFMDDMSPEVREYITMIETNFQLVMIAEYFDESLILLKDLLCWSLDDIVYFNQNARSQSSVRRVTQSMRREILDWNSADISMYNHFNRTLWGKIERYGAERMRREVEQLRLRNEILKKKCIGGKLESHDPRMWYPSGIKVDSFVVKPSARGERLCEQLIRPELTYIDILKSKQRAIAARPDRRDEFFRRHAQLREAHSQRYGKIRRERMWR